MVDAEGEGASAELLARVSNGDPTALAELWPLLASQLRLIARNRKRLHTGHRLDTTDILHEAYLKLAGSSVHITSRAHFFALCARCLRQVLVDNARSRARLKRGEGHAAVTIRDSLGIQMQPDLDILDLNLALDRLEAQDRRKARAIELVYFAGLSQKEAAVQMKVGLATIERDLTVAKAWLRRELQSMDSPPGKGRAG